MEDRRDCSLDRFMQSRGALMLGYSSYRASSAVQLMVGGILCTIGLSMIAVPLFGGDPGVAAGAIGPLAGGGVNLALGLTIRRRYASEQAVNVSLTPEAKGLLMALHRRLYGWRSPWAWSTNSTWCNAPIVAGTGAPFGSRRMARRARRAARWSGITPEMVPADLDDEELAALDRVAEQYNRTIGALESGKAGSASLAKLAPRILKAADETMAESLHQAAMLLKYPESGTATRTRLQGQEDALRELGDRVESMVTAQAGITDRLAFRSSIDDVLEELRLEQLARSELRIEDSPSVDQPQS